MQGDPMVSHSLRALICAELRAGADDCVALARRLVAAPSCTPTGDTTGVARVLVEMLQACPDIEVRQVCTAPHVANVVAMIRGGAGPGRRLILNGHLDTFPLGDPARWSRNPWGEVADGRLYGLGVSDMKGGVAASVAALLALARNREALRGEVVGVFVGDEETACGALGAQYLLDNDPEASGDAMICADIGAPTLPRVGEKGLLWLTIRATGRSAHAAHVHHGECAIERLLRIARSLSALRQWRPAIPAEVLEAIRVATAHDDLEARAEQEVLQAITMTIGVIRGGRLPNLVADAAEMSVDIRFPPGVSLPELEAAVAAIVAAEPGVALTVARRCAASWTDPDHPVVAALTRNCHAVIGAPAHVNLRIGASDARLYRHAGIPSVVCGLTPHNLGAGDEYIELEEMHGLAAILALTACDYLNGEA